jgi:hypothetical protein
MDATPLHWLDFEASEDEDGHATFDAMAAAAPAQLLQLQAEVLRVLAWARDAFGAPAPLEEGGEWDCELQGVQEVATTLEVRWDGQALDLQPRATGAPRVTLSVTLTGTAAFAAAFRMEFAV